MIKRVHLVFKTHLDIGFTDLASAVTERYMTQFIPSAIETARELRTRGGAERLVWTTGSWLIATYLEKASPENRKKLEEAIGRGDITWHALPFTTHTELMDAHLCSFGLSVSKGLDSLFGHTTIAGKMTDVPGHTLALVPLLSANGIQYMHIGVNGGSRVPEVPPLFRWSAPGGEEVIVHYDGSYGSEYAVEGMEDALVIAHGADNLGPPSVGDVLKAFEQASLIFPGAQIVASSLDAYARALLPYRDGLPVITSEIGDTWIHGTGSDPAKVARFRMFLRLAGAWVQSGKLKVGSTGYRHFMTSLLMVPEHTWGLDVKKYLADYKNWAPEDFEKARRKDIIGADAVPPEYAFIEDFVRKEYDMLLPGNIQRRENRTYSFFESSHAEQRAYIDEAYRALPASLQKEAVEEEEKLIPRRVSPLPHVRPVTTGMPVSFGKWTAVFDSEGAIVSLTGASGRELVDTKGGLGRYRYEAFDCSYYEAWHRSYGRNFEKNKPWVLPDFGKPGMENVHPPVEHRLYGATLSSLVLEETKEGHQVTAPLRADGTSPYGAPKTIVIRYSFFPDGKKMEISLDWFDKKATRLPEALWLSFYPHVQDGNSWRMVKLGLELPVFHSVPGGARYVHAVDSLIHRNRDEVLEILPLDSPLVSLEERRLLYMDTLTSGDFSGEFHFALYDNLWGTNFPMWYEEDGRSRFILSWKGV